jgi:hypothetical protein
MVLGYVICWFGKFCLAQVTFDSTYTEHFRRCGANSGWNAGDATISIPLPDGRAIWLFGDSYSNRPVCATHRVSCLFDVRNCMMIQSSTDDSVFETRQSAGTGYARSTFKYGTDNQINYFYGRDMDLSKATQRIFLCTDGTQLMA